MSASLIRPRPLQFDGWPGFWKDAENPPGVISSAAWFAYHPDMSFADRLRWDSFLEYAFLRWVLEPAAYPSICDLIEPQKVVQCGERTYRLDYQINGGEMTYAVELDGFEFHSSRQAFTYDRFRQNDIAASGRFVVRFSYDAIRRETARCVQQLQGVLRQDSALSAHLNPTPVVETPEMDPDPFLALCSSPTKVPMSDRFSFDLARAKLNRATLRTCQREALEALANYYLSGGQAAACVMAVGAGKTALGAAACLAFSRRRALVITPGRVIRGTFARAFDPDSSRNVLYALPKGPMLPGCPPPKTRTLDREDGAIKDVMRDDLLSADVVITNFHSLGSGESETDLLAKLQPEDVDFIVVDEAHIAASESYLRCFRRFPGARTLLMSACFSRLDGKPVEADVVYRYRLIDSIADGNAKTPCIRRFDPDPARTVYEMVWPDGSREEIFGRQAMLELLGDERRLARVTAKSDEPINQIMATVCDALKAQAEQLNPVKPRALFAALGERHAEQISRIANEHGIPCDYIHHSMTESRIKAVRKRFESDSGDLQAVVQLKMLGQGYDLPAISVVAPMRYYGSFSEFYQFIGRGIRAIQHPALEGRVSPQAQRLQIVYHAEMGLDEHIETIYAENDMDPAEVHEVPDAWRRRPTDPTEGLSTGRDSAERPEALVMFSPGSIAERVVHDEQRMSQRREERELEMLAQQYSRYAQDNGSPIPFDEFVKIRRLGAD